MEDREDKYIYCHFVEGDLIPGAEITIKDSHVEAVTRIYTECHNTLTKIGMKSSVEGSYAGVKGSLAITADHEDELKTSLYEKMESSSQNSLEQHFTMPEDARFGTVIWMVDFQIGGIGVSIPIDHMTQLWTKKSLPALMGHAMSQKMKQMYVECGGQLSDTSAKHKSVLYPPIKGKVCHHLGFLTKSGDGCYPDGLNCIELNGKQFVTCYHNDHKWIHGPGCDCTYIDGTHVRIQDAHDLSAEYPA